MVAYAFFKRELTKKNKELVVITPAMAGGSKLLKYKELYPNKNIWLWSGFKYEYVKDLDVMNYIDVLVDGQFRIDEFNPNLYYRGSSNQRVIDIKETLKQNKIVTVID